MREYKFRVFWYKDKITTSVDTIEFLHGGIRVSDGCYHIGWQGKDCELREFTGLHDKNGKEIYEGDIIKAKTFNYPLCIEWDRGECAFVMRSTHSGATYGFMWEIEIIGNIYDNPELLKEGSV